MQPVLRPTARVILIDESDRVLMFRHEGSFRTGDFSGTSLWALPGGGLEPGEQHEAAAQRELWEETGLTGITVGPCVWLRDHVFDWNGNTYEARERYHVCHVPHFVIDTGNQSPQELKEMTAYRWWALDEITAATAEVFVPQDLATHLEPILRGEYPDEPLRIGI
jgi:8-oxo-dGTP pyrophosphatase MutT (NUDIX family)